MPDDAGGGRTRTRGAAPVGVGINVPAIHYWMWLRRSPRTNTIKIDPDRLATMLGCGHSTIPRTIAKLVKAGRIKEVIGDHLPIAERGYVIADPAEFCTCGKPGCPALTVTPSA